MKNSAIIILVLSSFNLLFSQQKRNMYDENLYINCEKQKLNWKTVEISTKTYKYSLVKRNYFASDNGKNYYDGLIIFPYNKNDFNSSQLEEILKSISKKEKLFEVYAIRNCEAEKLFHSSNLSKEQQDILLKISLENLD